VVTSHLPLRGGKGTLYEGGTREPCIVVWPGGTKPGSQSEEVISSIDFYPSLLEMAGVKSKQGMRFDGISIVPALKGEKLQREAVFCHFPHFRPETGQQPGTYVRSGDWKLIRLYPESAEQKDRFELYHLQDDVGEANNLAAEMPAKVDELNARIEAFLKDTGALVPRPNPTYCPHTRIRKLQK
jgi:arylsulfatase A-like enzyme